MDNGFALLLGVLALVVMVTIVAWTFKRKLVWLANWILSLLFFVARSSLIIYIRPLHNPATAENRGAYDTLNNSFFILLGYTIATGLLVIFFDMIVPKIHKYYRLEKTPPGQPDKVVPSEELIRRRSA